MMQFPSTHPMTYRLGCLVADRRDKADKHLPPAIHGLPGTKGIAEKIKLLPHITAAPVGILAIHDPSLLGMELQFAGRKTNFQGLAQRARLSFTFTMANGVIGVTLKRHIGVAVPHPPVE